MLTAFWRKWLYSRQRNKSALLLRRTPGKDTLPPRHGTAEGVITARYIIKWIPKDQGVVIDHTKRYEKLTEAMTVARNLLQLAPKRIWIEDEECRLHTDYDAILRL
jgi:hypothetical protein